MTAVVVEVLEQPNTTVQGAPTPVAVEALSVGNIVVEVIEQGPQGIPGIAATELDVDPTLLFENALI
jgi:hypothetical protein